MDKDVARRVLEVVPVSMMVLRSMVSKAIGSKISLPQFRVMNFIDVGINRVGMMAEHYGVSQPAMSKMVDSLVKLHLVERKLGEGDRRKILLSLTKKGREWLEEHRDKAQEAMAKRLSVLNSQQKKVLLKGLTQLTSLFSDYRKLNVEKDL